MSINLLPWRESAYQRTKKKLLMEGVGYLLIGLSGLLFLENRAAHHLIDQQKEKNNLNQQLSQMDKPYKEAFLKEKSHKDDRQKATILKNKKIENQKELTLLNSLVNEIPDTLFLVQISKSADKLYLSGNAPSHAELSDFIQNIEAKTHRQPVLTETGHSDSGEQWIFFKLGYEIQ